MLNLGRFDRRRNGRLSMSAPKENRCRFGQSDIHRLDWSSAIFRSGFCGYRFQIRSSIRRKPWVANMGKPRILYCYEQFPVIAIPIGCFDDLNVLFAHYKNSPDFQDERTNGVAIGVSFSQNCYLKQEAAALKLVSAENGILSATTAFGKTVVALWLIGEEGQLHSYLSIGRNFLISGWSVFPIFGNSSRLVRSGGRKRTGLIDVAVIQSVSAGVLLKKDGSRIWAVIVDECHHISALSFEQAIRACSARYKVGLSATLARKDSQHLSY